MKKILFLTLSTIMALSIISCSSDNDPETHKLTVSPSSLTFEAKDSSTKTITVTAENVEWEAAVENATENSWVSIQTNDDKISVTVSENTGNERKATITVTPKNTDEVDVRKITVTQKMFVDNSPLNIALESGVIEIQGDPNFIAAPLYNVKLISGGEFYLENDGTVSIDIDKGYYFSFYFIGEDISAESFANVALPNGTYNISMDLGDSEFEFEQKTFIKSYSDGTDPAGSIIETIEGGKPKDIMLISSGTVTVENSGSNVKMTFNLTLTTGKEVTAVFNNSFVAQLIDTYNTIGESDEEFTNGEASYTNWVDNDYYEWGIYLTTEGLTINGNTATGTGYYTILNIITDRTVSTEVLPSGTYEVAPPFYYETAVAGFIYSGYLMGSWVIKFDNGNMSGYAPFYASSSDGVKITDMGEGNYRIEYDVVSDDFSSLKGVYEGPIEISQISSTSSMMKSKSIYSSSRNESMFGNNNKFFN